MKYNEGNKRKSSSSVRDPAVVSYTLSQVRSKDTSPEVTLRKALWAAGLRYRKNYKEASGSPDIAFVKEKVAVFCDGIFWHGRDWESRKERIKSNRDYWIPKIERNMARDEKVNTDLLEAGWLVLRFWETDIKEDLEGCVETIEDAVKSRRIESGDSS